MKICSTLLPARKMQIELCHDNKEKKTKWKGKGKKEKSRAEKRTVEERTEQRRREWKSIREEEVGNGSQTTEARLVCVLTFIKLKPTRLSLLSLQGRELHELLWLDSTAGQWAKILVVILNSWDLKLAAFREWYQSMLVELSFVRVSL